MSRIIRVGVSSPRERCTFALIDVPRSFVAWRDVHLLKNVALAILRGERPSDDYPMYTEAGAIAMRVAAIGGTRDEYALAQALLSKRCRSS